MENKLSEVVFVVEEDEDGGFFAHAIGYAIVTQGDTLSEIQDMIKDAVMCHFDDDERPDTIRIQIMREQVISVK